MRMANSQDRKDRVCVAFVAFLDACVLYPTNLRDVLLSIAEAGVCQIRWSEDVLDEMERNVANRAKASNRERAAQGAAYVRREMTQAFEDAMVERESYLPLVHVMAVNEKDKHVLAAAIVSGASVIVTDNTKDFPRDTVGKFGIDVQSADEFLLYQFELSPRSIVLILQRMAKERHKPMDSVDGALRALEKSVPRFSSRAIQYIHQHGPLTV